MQSNLCVSIRGKLFPDVHHDFIMLVQFRHDLLLLLLENLHHR
jgi:hypothetical protein